jgi:hypothetical protein
MQEKNCTKYLSGQEKFVVYGLTLATPTLSNSERDTEMRR